MAFSNLITLHTMASSCFTLINHHQLIWHQMLHLYLYAVHGISLNCLYYLKGGLLGALASFLIGQLIKPRVCACNITVSGAYDCDDLYLILVNCGKDHHSYISYRVHPMYVYHVNLCRTLLVTLIDQFMTRACKNNFTSHRAKGLQSCTLNHCLHNWFMFRGLP